MKVPVDTIEMDEGPGTALRRLRRSKTKGNRAWIATTAVGATLLVVSAIVFAVSAGTKGLTTHAESVHIADETLRIATVARAQVAMANHFASFERELAVAVDDQLVTSSEQASNALDLMAAGVDQLVESGGFGPARVARQVCGLHRGEEQSNAVGGSGHGSPVRLPRVGPTIPSRGRYRILGVPDTAVRVREIGRRRPRRSLPAARLLHIA